MFRFARVRPNARRRCLTDLRRQPARQVFRNRSSRRSAPRFWAPVLTEAGDYFIGTLKRHATARPCVVSNNERKGQAARPNRVRASANRLSAVRSSHRHAGSLSAEAGGLRVAAPAVVIELPEQRWRRGLGLTSTSAM